MKTRYLVFLFAMLGCAVNAQNFNFTSNIHTTRIQQASAKLRNVFVKALLWC